MTARRQRFDADVFRVDMAALEHASDLLGLAAYLHPGLTKFQREQIMEKLRRTPRLRKRRGNKRNPEIWNRAVTAMRLRLAGEATRKMAPCMVASDGRLQKAVTKCMDNHKDELVQLAKSTPRIRSVF